jgi:GNAT superfamily N-acetyltransferase
MSTAVEEIAIERLPDDFDRWDDLLGLILSSFAFMDGVIDPPSSAHRLTPASLAGKAAKEFCFIAKSGGQLIGCVFAAERPDALYVGKLAVDPAEQGGGIGRRLMDATEELARRLKKSALELETRIELTGNHAAFRRLGFVEVGRIAHAGYDRPTSIRFQKRLA